MEIPISSQGNFTPLNPTSRYVVENCFITIDDRGSWPRDASIRESR